MAALLCAPLQGQEEAEDEPFVSAPSALRVGHYVELRGAFDESELFHASDVELVQPQKYEMLIGRVPEQAAPVRFPLLGFLVEVEEGETEFARMQLEQLPGALVKIEGRWKGARKFSAREISPRGGGRERLGARIDAIRAVAGGVELELMARRVFVAHEVEVEHEDPIDAIELAPRRAGSRVLTPLMIQVDSRPDDDDDLIPGSIQLAEGWTLGGLLQQNDTFEDDYDLDSNDRDDLEDFEGNLRARLVWEGNEAFAGTVTVRHASRYRFDEDGREIRNDTRLGETFLVVRKTGVEGLELVLGRQDFDEPREWIHDQLLDGVRAIYRRDGLRAELSATSTFGEGSRREKAADNFLLHVSNDDEDRHLAAWALKRDIELDGVSESPLHLGVRLMGDEWLDDHDLWADAAWLTGSNGDLDYQAFGFDVGTTWSPDRLGPFSFTTSWAFGSGDTDANDSVDGSFRQTGFQDNNGKWSGLTSFRLYGELLDPELSNLSILTAGLGWEVSRDTSVDLVLHHYAQARADSQWAGGTDLETAPNGLSRDLGFEVDLVLGSRRFRPFDLELVGAWFHPGDGFDAMEDAFLARFQLRYRF